MIYIEYHLVHLSSLLRHNKLQAQPGNEPPLHFSYACIHICDRHLPDCVYVKTDSRCESNKWSCHLISGDFVEILTHHPFVRFYCRRFYCRLLLHEWVMVVSRWMWVAGRWMFVVGCWVVLVVGCWSLVLISRLLFVV